VARGASLLFFRNLPGEWVLRGLDDRALRAALDWARGFLSHGSFGRFPGVAGPKLDHGPLFGRNRQKLQPVAQPRVITDARFGEHRSDVRKLKLHTDELTWQQFRRQNRSESSFAQVDRPTWHV